MIAGSVTSDGVPQILLPIAGRTWVAVVDSGFNGDLELPEAVRDDLSPHRIGTVISALAAGRTVEEPLYAVRFSFDGETIEAEATFVAGEEVLVGTRLLRNHRLTIDFPARSVHVERADEGR